MTVRSVVPYLKSRSSSTLSHLLPLSLSLSLSLSLKHLNFLSYFPLIQTTLQNLPFLSSQFPFSMARSIS
ncbi:MAG: hypothetical protein J8272_00810, partial ['Prunus persica' phytoplasma PP2]|nr:hypothetical protein ['Prunus persica' phytoplasma PP2]